MSEDGDPRADVEYLARSAARVEIVRALREGGELSRRDLREAVSASRSAVQRGVDGLVEKGWVRADGRTYELSAVGRLVAEDFERLLETAGLAQRLEPITEWLDDRELDFDLRALADATVTTATDGDPYAPVTRHLAGVEATETFRALLPSTGIQPLRRMRKCLVEETDRSHALIVDRGVAETLRSDEFRPVVEEVLATGRCEIRVLDGEFDHYLGLLDGGVQIGIEDDDGIPRALVETDRESVRSWAERRFERAHAESDPLTL